MSGDIKDIPKNLCVAPWIGLHVNHYGEVFPCSTFAQESPMTKLPHAEPGDLRNVKKMRNLRCEMLRNQQNVGCSQCFNSEKNGGGSLRGYLNHRFPLSAELLNQTSKDGALPQPQTHFFDIQFSNVCNFKCRICGPKFSSSWQEDFNLLYNQNSTDRIAKIFRSHEEMKDYFKALVPEFNEIYFWGGEPLISSEMYDFLEMLIAAKRTDIHLRYNTNLSVLNLNSRNLWDLWSHFPNVSLNASLDGYGPRGELMRKGMSWKEIESNRRMLSKKAAHVKFRVTSAVSLMNAWHMPDFHKYLVDSDFIKTNEMEMNLVFVRPFFQVTVLPKKIKTEIQDKINEYISVLEKNPENSRTVNGFKSIISFMNSNDNSHLLTEFLDFTLKLDAIRQESFFTIFPELAELKLETRR